MENHLSHQALSFLQAVLLGGALGVLYDGFRIGRLFGKAGAVRVFFADLLFSFLAAFATAVFLSRSYYGEVRFFLLAGEGLGFLIYFNTLGALVLRFFRRFRRILEKFMNFLKKPFIFLLRWCKIILYHYARRGQLEGKGHQKSK